MRDHIRLLINGREVTVSGDEAFMTLASYLRLVRGAMGTKIVCEEGDCGACTVLIGRLRGDSVDYRAVNSCIQFMFQLDATHVITVEGLAENGQLNAVQEAMIEEQGAQCGYCTPGFVVTMTGLCEASSGLTDQAVREGLTGNLCRCTGYEPIIKAALVSQSKTAPRIDSLYPSNLIRQQLSAIDDAVRIETEARTFHGPIDIEGALEIKASAPPVAIVQGSTDFGVIWNKRAIRPANVMSLARVSGLDNIERLNGALVVGGRATLADLEVFSREAFPQLFEILSLFGSPQIRHSGTLAGNIANASPIADTLPALFVMEANLELSSTAGTRTVPINSFYMGYKKLNLQENEIITRILIPLPSEDETLRLYKVSKRRDLDISTFTAAIRMRIAGDRMTDVKIAYGGVAPVVLRLPETERLLEGRVPEEDIFHEAGRKARTEITPISDVRGSAEFRSQLAENILMKFYWETVGTSQTAAVS